jgi:hypothetical protein
MSRRLATVLVLAVAVGCVRRTEPVVLRVAAPADRVLRYETSIDADQEGFMGMTLAASGVVRWSLAPAGEDDGLRLALRVESLDARVRGLPFGDGGNEGRVTPPIPEPLRDGSLALRLDSRARLRALAGIERLVADPSESEQTRGSFAQSLVRGATVGIVERTLRGLVQAFGILPLPEEAVAPGATWSEKGVVAFPMVAQIDYDNHLVFRESTLDAAGAPLRRVSEDMSVTGSIALPAAGESGMVQIDRGFVTGDVDLDSGSLPLAADVRCGITISASMRGPDDRERGVAVTFRSHVVTKRVATETVRR